GGTRDDVGGDEVEGPDLVVGAPASPVPKPGAILLEQRGRDRGARRHRSLPRSEAPWQCPALDVMCRARQRTASGPTGTRGRGRRDPFLLAGTGPRVPRWSPHDLSDGTLVGVAPLDGFEERLDLPDRVLIQGRAPRRHALGGPTLGDGGVK